MSACHTQPPTHTQTPTPTHPPLISHPTSTQQLTCQHTCQGEGSKRTVRQLLSSLPNVLLLFLNVSCMLCKACVCVFDASPTDSDEHDPSSKLTSCYKFVVTYQLVDKYVSRLRYSSPLLISRHVSVTKTARLPDVTPPLLT